MDTRQLLGVADPQRKQTAKRTEENPNWAGRSKPGPSRIRLHLDAVDFDRVAVHGARNSHLVASVGHNLILVRNLIDLTFIGQQDCYFSAFEAFGSTCGIPLHTLDGRALLVDDGPGPIRGHRPYRAKRKHSQYFFHNAPLRKKTTQSATTILHTTPSPKARML